VPPAVALLSVVVELKQTSALLAIGVGIGCTVKVLIVLHPFLV
jgi:hypothetical protein